ncbi:non-reducing end alpha-L-arabinofuranosidase family hydrolase [Marinagarivorans cellulosilyticus]|uniref:Alpha-L-arabinofuranosidase n=1 Tax=Marinagarivorans cellulosilyticus TaxID=2721545 RepID=A0AAN1WGV4_9GAMM|nr:non-reducing end alpha-L-arabinofuranosidase family hydrolase [Marinagarivorans cellulosilyticus]BCD97375.1 endo-1,4-beta-xylanase [Marinagarivorans cellulosilyticus]
MITKLKFLKSQEEGVGILHRNNSHLALALIMPLLLASCDGGSVASSSEDVASSMPVAVSSIASSSSEVVIPGSSSVAQSSSVAASMPSIPAGSSLVYAVNAGGGAVTVDGIEYKADRFSTGGNVNSVTNAIDGTTADAVYQAERYGTYNYEIPVTNSTYSVKMHFAELFQTAADSRYFSLTVEGQLVFTDKDLYDEVGQFTAFDVVLPAVMVADETLTIELSTSLDNATISGFAIYSNAGGQFVEPPEPVGCDLPNSLSWTSTGPIITPKNGDVSVKDPSIVYYQNKYHVFATVYNSSYKSMYTTFTDFDNVGAGTYQSFLPGGSATVAPQVFYFSPQNKWYIFTQWPAKYTTNDDINNVNGWARPTTLWPGNDEYGGALDYWVICDDSDCYLYFYKDDGRMLYVKTSIGNFPNFDVNQVKVADIAGSGGQNIIFEAGNVYKIKGSDEYLLQVEGWGAREDRRLYRSWTSTSLDGPWVAHKTSESDPFAGLSNVDGDNWSIQVSHGEMIRAGYDEKMELDTCNMQMLYQGITQSGSNNAPSYNERPYNLGLLRAK